MLLRVLSFTQDRKGAGDTDTSCLLHLLDFYSVIDEGQIFVRLTLKWVYIQLHWGSWYLVHQVSNLISGCLCKCYCIPPLSPLEMSFNLPNGLLEFAHVGARIIQGCSIENVEVLSLVILQVICWYHDLSVYFKINHIYCF